MKVTKKFLDNLWFKGGWQLETINDKSYNTITNPVYCKLFWTQYWKDILAEKFSKQNHITEIENGDLTSKVIIDPNTNNILSAPRGWANIYYGGSLNAMKDDNLKPTFSNNFDYKKVLIFYFVFIIVVIILVTVLPVDKKIVNLV